MPIAAIRLRFFSVAASVAVLLGLLLTPAAGAMGSGTPGKTFGRAIERAQAERASKLEACAAKPHRTARETCERAAESTFTTALEKAQVRRAEERR